MNRNGLIGLVVAAAAVFAGWYFASPVYAMNQLRDAAKSGEEAQLEGAVDFPVLRESLKAELRTNMEGRLDDVAGGALGDLGASLGMAMIDPLVDELITPEAIATVVRQGDVVRRDPPSADGTKGPERMHEGEWTMERDGLSRFTARPKDGDTGLVFERRGLGWKLVGIDLPQT